MSDDVKIVFPQPEYPIRVIGDSHEELREQVITIVRRHDETFRADGVELVKSREGTYCSVRLSILATGEPQLKALHAELMAHPLVRMVL
jgi:putative lipoic acid-binding regulatory protein